MCNLGLRVEEYATLVGCRRASKALCQGLKSKGTCLWGLSLATVLGPGGFLNGH